MLKRTEGIVLKTAPFGEADLIVTYLTPDFGLLNAFAKSPRKIKSRFGSSLEPFTHSRISFWGKEDTTLPRLTQSDIIYSFQSIRDTLSCFLKVSEIIEINLHFIPERVSNKNAYFLLLNTLHDIENNQSLWLTKKVENRVRRPDTTLHMGSDIPKAFGTDLSQEWFSEQNLVINYYKIKFLELMGYAPKLDACGRCGKNGDCFYVSHGSILCEVCAKGMDSPARLSPGVVKLYAVLFTWDVTKIKRIRPSDMLLSELSDMIDMHIEYILAKPLKSKSFICHCEESAIGGRRSKPIKL